jgi:hypothetical protein
MKLSGYPGEKRGVGVWISKMPAFEHRAFCFSKHPPLGRGKITHCNLTSEYNKKTEPGFN